MQVAIIKMPDGTLRVTDAIGAERLGSSYPTVKTVEMDVSEYDQYISMQDGYYWAQECLTTLVNVG